MVALVTVDTADFALRLDLVRTGSPATITDERLPDVQMKIDQASDIIIDYLKIEAPDWTPETVPPRVQSAVLILCSALFENREGQEIAGLFEIGGTIFNLLVRMRDPALA